MIGLKEKPVRNNRLVLREEFDDWAILFDPESGAGYGLNPVSAMIWKNLDGRHTLSEILEIVHERFSDVPETAQEEILSFVTTLLEKGYAGQIL